MRVLADRGAVLGACLLMVLAPGAVGAAEVVWLLLAVVVGGLCAVADGRRGAIARISSGETPDAATASRQESVSGGMMSS